MIQCFSEIAEEKKSTRHRGEMQTEIDPRCMNQSDKFLSLEFQVKSKN